MTLVWAVILSLAAAFANALSGVLQRVAAAHHLTPKLFDRHFMGALFRSRLWLVGAGFDVLGFLLQAAALGIGSLVIVSPVMTTDIIFLMAILGFRFKVQVGPREWWSALAICLGLSGLLAATHPQGGNLAFEPERWIILSTVVGSLIILTIVLVRRMRYGQLRAAITGLSTGANFALTAGLTKLAVAQFELGFGPFLTSWELYGMIASAAVSLVMIQNTYGAGSLAVSQPVLAVATPVFGVIIGLVMFGDHVSTSIWAMVLAVISATVLALGVVFLTSSRRIIESKL